MDSCCVIGVNERNHKHGKLPVAFVALKEAFKGQESTIKESLVVIVQRKTAGACTTCEI